MKGQETVPINDVSLANLLGLPPSVYEIIVGVPKNPKDVKPKNFKPRVQRAKRAARNYAGIPLSV